jgi:hypothetical protein
VVERVRKPTPKKDLQEDILESRILETSEDSVRLSLKLMRSNIVTFTYDTEHLIHYTWYGRTRASSRSVATKIAELEDAGTAQEREKPPGNDREFLWIMHSYWRYQQVDGGVLVEYESLTLSREVPFILTPFVKPIISNLAEKSMKRTLTSMRERFATAKGQGLGIGPENRSFKEAGD